MTVTASTAVMKLTDRLQAVLRDAQDLATADTITSAYWEALRDTAYDVVRVANQKLGL